MRQGNQLQTFLLTDQIALSDCLCFLRYVHATVYFPGCDVINFRINLIVLIKPLFYKTKKSREKFKYLENEKYENTLGTLLFCFLILV